MRGLAAKYHDHARGPPSANDRAGHLGRHVSRSRAGRAPERASEPQEVRRQADALQARLHKRPEQLDREAQISALLPVVMGGLVVVPVGPLAKIAGRSRPVAAQAVEAAVR